MDTAAQELQYEKAASILKKIRHLEHIVEANQLVVKVEGKNSDVLAIYRQGQELILAQLLFREGKLTGVQHFSFSRVAQEDAELLSSFILQHYTQEHLLPSEILLPIALKEAAALMEILKDKFQKKIALTTPKKGEKLALVALAEKNAKAQFEREKDRKS